MADAEALVALKDLLNYNSSEGLCTEEFSPWMEQGKLLEGSGGMADAEALVALKDLNYNGSEGLCTEEFFPMDGAG